MDSFLLCGFEEQHFSPTGVSTSGRSLVGEWNAAWGRVRVLGWSCVSAFMLALFLLH